MNDKFFIYAENALFAATILLYFIAMAMYFFIVATKNEKRGGVAQRILTLGFIAHTLAIIVRGIGAGRVPLANQYEFATAFAWGIALFFMIYMKKYKLNSIGAFIAPILFLIIGYAAMQNRTVRPLMPALQSGWLVIHVSMAVIGYGAFAVAAGVSLMYLAKRKSARVRALALPSDAELDSMSYKAVKVGYLFLTLCIITGAIWAQYAWGRYWAWDPKETWSLITWIIYTIYLHQRFRKGMKDTKAAWFCVVGFLCVVFTYIGVNNLLPSLHSYV